MPNPDMELDRWFVVEVNPNPITGLRYFVAEPNAGWAHYTRDVTEASRTKDFLWAIDLAVNKGGRVMVILEDGSLESRTGYFPKLPEVSAVVPRTNP